MVHIPSKQEILNWISENPTKTNKRDIAKAFGLKGAARIDLKRMLRELEADGDLQKRQRSYGDPESLTPVSMLEIVGPNSDGDLLARPLEWQGQGEEPTILMVDKDGDPALGAGNRILARLRKLENEEHGYEGRLIRQIGSNPLKLVGIFRTGHEGGRLVPIDKGSDKEWQIAAGATLEARDGELVEAQQVGPKSRMGLPRAKIVARLGDPSSPKAVSLIAIHQHGIPDSFPDEVIGEADNAKPAGLGKRLDLREMPLVTIDPPDARDHDDACFAQADDDATNPNGHIVWVAIADVAFYVTPGSALDREARKRGNSSYFPDRVVPMLPDRLSGDLCSLHEGVERACIAVRMVLDKDGNKLGHTFHRAMMKSHASLAYTDVQSAMDGDVNEKCAPLLDEVIRPLYAAYDVLVKARERRQPLELNLPERRIELSDEGKVTSISFRDRLDAHRLIEEFMVLANVAAAETLIEKEQPLLFRVHEEPSVEKLEALRETAISAGLALAKGQVLKTRHLNQLLAQAAKTEHDELINISTLRSMTQAYYSPENFSHFGLALKNYGHFTSPIRRYADLIVHRALITAHGWGKDGLSPEDVAQLDDTAKQISDTERRSMVAERDTTDRYLASYLSERVGNEFQGRVAGIARFGAFIKLDETGADGLVPVATIGREYFVHDPEANTLTGEHSGLKISLGQRALVRLAEATPVTGGITLELLELDGKALPKGGGSRGGKSHKGRRVGQARAKNAKMNRKVARKRTKK
ncbi:ribonuclease R [Falsihalocynthiibacter sp. BN13B15]|uniref:ribonuclease R n=1 Tax=Falsihalocynthiibacter sp. BN13B15 TaxID=3240871 RepID=UPI003510418D